MFNYPCLVYDGSMSGKKKSIVKTTSCGTLTYRLAPQWIDTEILLVKQFSKKGNWGVPKGHINPGETIEKCAIRETKEETGIDVELGMRLTDTLASYKKEEKTVVTYLAVQTCDNHPDASDPDSEVADVRWFKVSELPGLVRYQESVIHEGIEAIKAIWSSQRG